MARKPSPWQIGDRIRLIEAKEYLRTGYPMYLPEVIEDVQENHLNTLDNVLKAAGLPVTIRNHGVISRFVEAIAYGMIYQKGFGGRERSIYEADLDPEILDIEFKIIDKFGTMTGTYYPPSGGRSWDGEYDYECGGLDKQVYNTILILAPAHLGFWMAQKPNAARKRHKDDPGYLHVWSKRTINLTRPQTPAQTELQSEIVETSD